MSAQPSIEATVHPDGTASITVDGQITHLDTVSVDQARSQALALVTEHARTTGIPVRAVMHDAQGNWPVIVHPDGRVEPGPQHTGEPRGPEPTPPAAAPASPEDPSQAEQPARREPSGEPVTGAGVVPPPWPSGDHTPGHRNPGIGERSGAEAPMDPAGTTGSIDGIGGPDAVAAANDAQEKPPDPALAPATADPLDSSTGPGPGGNALPENPEHHAARQSFLTHEHPEQPADHGWRGALARMGLHLEPSDAERAERADEQAVSQHWPGQRTIAVVNGKGGVGKTPTTIVLSAVFARYGGAGVLAWDNNQTRGTLGWRTEQGPHDSTVLDLLPETERLLGTGAQSADLARFVHHQGRDKFDVLRSKPMALAQDQRVSPHDVDAVHAVAAKYYRLILMDSGNDESDPMWLRMIDHADQLVLVTTTRKDHAEAGALLLEALAERNERSAALAGEAVALITRADPKASDDEMARIAAGYETLVRQVVRIPHDPALVDGQITYEALHPASRRAWLTAAAAVAHGLGKKPSQQ